MEYVMGDNNPVKAAALDASAPSSGKDSLYRGYHISYDPPPIPIRAMDWQFVHDDYDGAPNEPGDGPADHRCGHAASEQACRDEIDMIEDDQ